MPSRRRRIGPVYIITLLLLSCAFGTGSYAVTSQVIAQSRASAKSTPRPSLTTSQSPSPSPSSEGCPEVTRQAVALRSINADLTLQIHVKFHPASGTGASAEAWVCSNANGKLIYQGHVQSAPLDSAESDTSLLLIDGVKGKVQREGDGFVAINTVGGKKTEYHVTSTQFVLINSGGSKTTYIVDQVTR